jgi:hypothetical protein
MTIGMACISTAEKACLVSITALFYTELICVLEAGTLKERFEHAEERMYCGC